MAAKKTEAKDDKPVYAYTRVLLRNSNAGFEKGDILRTTDLTLAAAQQRDGRRFEMCEESDFKDQQKRLEEAAKIKSRQETRTGTRRPDGLDGDRDENSPS